ncbi:hypothetical protein Hanom_Chr02g00140971 [Helianthus anomalus]
MVLQHIETTPVDQLPRIDAQLAQSQHIVAKYSGLGGQGGNLGDDKELDQFMVRVKDCELIMFCCFVLLKSNCSNMFVFTLWKLLSHVGRSSSR